MGTEIGHFRNILAVLGGSIFQDSSSSDESVHVAYKVISNVPVRVYSPKSANAKSSLPIMIYYHGGGFIFGSTDGYHTFLVEFVKRLNIVVASIELALFSILKSHLT